MAQQVHVKYYLRAFQAQYIGSRTLDRSISMKHAPRQGKIDDVEIAYLLVKRVATLEKRW